MFKDKRSTSIPVLKEKNTKICFVCGEENPFGLHVTFARDHQDGSRATYEVRPEHVGWPDLLHGGVLFTLMDEAVAWALYYNGMRGVTAKAETRYRNPVAVGTQLLITGSITDRSRRLVRARAEAKREDGDQEIVAELNATMYLIDGGRPSLNGEEEGIV
jgi:acyl-coenzyme A thioesterase PaaI-like protein